MDTAALKRTVYRYLDCYQTTLQGWWDTMGPTDYICILVASLMLSWALLKGTARTT